MNQSHSSPEPKIEMVPIDQIRVINPRFRDKRKFGQIVNSVHSIGLKKPITISRRSIQHDGDADGYDLVCGQGRMEAYQKLGHTVVPAIIIDVPLAERLLMSLVENIARRHVSGVSQIRNVAALKGQGYSHAEIARKIGLSEPYVGHLLRLVEKGEERLLNAVLKGKIPVTVAIEIADMADEATQVQLLEAYAQKKIPKGALLTIKRLLEKRRLYGKAIKPAPGTAKVSKAEPSGATLMAAYQRETRKQKDFIGKSKVCESKLYLIVGALKHLRRDENFMTLLRAEDLLSMPEQLAKRLD